MSSDYVTIKLPTHVWEDIKRFAAQDRIDFTPSTKVYDSMDEVFDAGLDDGIIWTSKTIFNNATLVE